MKQIAAFSFLLLLGFLTMSFTMKDSLSVDITNSTVEWVGYKVTGQHSGMINLKSGSLDFEGDALVGGYFEIDMTSIKTTDMNEKMNAKLDGHLKSEDFFGTEKYPVATFAITKVISRGTAGDYKIVGDMTIKETTKEIKFQVNIDRSSGVPIAMADIKIDRSEFDVKYGSGSFFDNLGDKTIYDEFDLKLKIATVK